MKVNPQIALALHILMFLGFGSSVLAQMSSAATMESQPTLTADQIVQKMVLKNLERARALEAYSGTRVWLSSKSASFSLCSILWKTFSTRKWEPLSDRMLNSFVEGER